VGDSFECVGWEEMKLPHWIKCDWSPWYPVACGNDVGQIKVCIICGKVKKYLREIRWVGITQIKSVYERYFSSSKQ
jgi:hypothetical protein